MSRRHTRSVAGVVADGLCMGCGACVAACPTGAISMAVDAKRGVYLPKVDASSCVECAACLSVCPGRQVAFSELTERFVDGEKWHRLLGRYSACFIGCATDPTIRREGASGGVVGALLGWLLEAGAITGALTVRMRKSLPFVTEAFIARTREDLSEAAGSKYCPSSTCAGISWLREGEASERYAFVGLPCQIHGLRKLLAGDRVLDSKIVLTIGLFCANNNTSLGTEYFLQSRGIAPTRVGSIRYRDGDWPGRIAITLADGERLSFARATTEPHWTRRALFASAFHYDFQIPRCLLCPDQTAELADVAVGDPWLPEIKASETEGLSLVIARNSRGRRALEDAIAQGCVQLSPVAEDTATRAQNYSFKSSVGARIALRRWFRCATPEYGKRPMPYGWRRLLGALRYVPSYITHRRYAWPGVKALALMHYLARRCLAAAIRGVRGCMKAVVPRRPRQAGRARVALAQTAKPRLLLLGAPIRNNLGGPSLLFSTARVLVAALPDALLQFASADPQDEAPARAAGFGFVRTIPGRKLLVAAALRRWLGVRPRSKWTADLLDAYAQADALVDIWGIGFSDQLGTDSFRARATQGLRFLAARVMGTPVVKYTADLGPFERRWNRFFSRLYLTHTVDLILARSATTATRVRELGVRTPVHVLPDTAFLLDAATSRFAESLTLAATGKPIIGVSVSHMAARQAPSAAGYYSAMAGLADEIVSRIGASLVFIPNETSSRREEDDREACREVLALMSQKSAAVIAPTEELSASELKGVIGVCSAVVASRYHTIVAAISMAIPVLAIGWHAKYESVMALVGQDALVADVRSLSPDALCTQFFSMWQSRAERSESLQKALPAVRKQIMEGGALVRSLLEHKR